MSPEFPVRDDDIRALRIKVLRQLAGKQHPKESIGLVAASNGVTVEDIRSLVIDFGYPDCQLMAEQAIVLAGNGSPHKPPAAVAPVAAGGGVDTIAAGLGSRKARTRRLAERIREQLTELRGLVLEEREEQRVAQVAIAEQAHLREEVAKLERELAAKKALLKQPTKARETTTPQGNARVIREWAASAGVACPVKGRVPATVVTAYEAACSSGSA